jgi:hypothetical protein
MKTWVVGFIGMFLALTLVSPALAEVRLAQSRSPQDLVALFPSPFQLPPGMVLADAGSRSASEIAATFPDPAETAQQLATYGWATNAYRTYVAGPGAGPTTPARLEISLHQFLSNTGAAYALPAFAHARAVMLDQAEGPTAQLRPCEAATSGSSDATRYLRIGDLLVRVTVVMPGPPNQDTYSLALGTSVDVASAVLGNAGGSWQWLDQTCR